MTAEEAPRIWAGRTMAERQEDRRDKLLRAGVALIAAGGGQAVSVRAACREAGLTSRYFYEQFADREEYVVAVYRAVAEECNEAVRAAVADLPPGRSVAAAAVDAVVGLALDDPDKGRVLFVAPTTDPSLFAAREQHLPVIADMIADQFPARDGAEERALKSASLVGALGHVFYLYVSGRLAVPREVFVAHCVDLLTTIAVMRVAQ
jgi:AcrR family transcriptional regulator